VFSEKEATMKRIPITICPPGKCPGAGYLEQWSTLRRGNVNIGAKKRKKPSRPRKLNTGLRRRGIMQKGIFAVECEAAKK
jgi:hypothetical protein